MTHSKKWHVIINIFCGLFLIAIFVGMWLGKSFEGLLTGIIALALGNNGFYSAKAGTENYIREKQKGVNV